MEIWKEVPSKPGIMASSLGRILLPKREAKMPHGGVRTYHPKPVYGVITKSKKTAEHKYYGMYSKFYGNMKIHRLVCEAFHGPPPEKKSVVLHKDENALNNRPENLAWGTQKENFAFPKIKEKMRSRNRIISPEDGEIIRARFNNGESQKDIAKDYGVSFQTISLVCSKGRSSDKEWR